MDSFGITCNNFDLEHVRKVTHRLFEFAIENAYVRTETPISKGLMKRVKRFVASSRETTSADDLRVLPRLPIYLEETDINCHVVKGS